MGQSEYERGVDDAFKWILRQTRDVRELATDDAVKLAMSHAFEVVQRLRAELRVQDLKKPT
jgi:hypothetical protein